MKKQYPSETQDRFMVRLPDGMREQIALAAKRGNRTMNSEIVSRLEFSFAADAIVEDVGWSVGHGHETPEFRAAYQRSQTLEQRVAQLEAQMAKLVKSA